MLGDAILSLKKQPELSKLNEVALSFWLCISNNVNATSKPYSQVNAHTNMQKKFSKSSKLENDQCDHWNWMDGMR